MVVQASVGYQEYLASRDFPVDDAAHIDARFAYQVTAQLDHDSGLPQAVRQSVEQPGEAGADRCDVERTLAGKVGDAKTAPDIQKAHGGGRVLGELDCELDRLLLSLLDRICTQVLRAAEDVKTMKIAPEPPESREHCRHALGVYAELLGPSPHFHSRAFQLEIGVNPHRHARRCSAA